MIDPAFAEKPADKPVLGRRFPLYPDFLEPSRGRPLMPLHI